MGRTRIAVRVCFALAAIGCTTALEPLDLESPDDDGDIAELEPTLPDATRPPPAATEADEARAACKRMLGDAEGTVRRELETLCDATRHDGDCVGFLCERTAPREAFECLLEAGHAARVIALEHADVPAARAFAREALTRQSAWNETRIRDALDDEGVVDECAGCVCMSTELSAAGLRQLSSNADRAAMQPLLAEWAAAEPAELAVVLRERPTEKWMSDARLRALIADTTKDPELRATAAYALARRGDDAGREELYAATRHASSDVRNLAVIGLDALDEGEAWDRLAPLLDDEVQVRISLMRLGARLRPDDAVATLDTADMNRGAEAMPELPTRLFAPRAVRAICSHHGVDDDARARLVAALERLPKRARCKALVKAEKRCAWSTGRGAMAHAVAPGLAVACGIAPPPVSSWSNPPQLSRCHRTRRTQEAAIQREGEAKALDAERRAKAAANAELLELERRAKSAADRERARSAE